MKLLNKKTTAEVKKAWKEVESHERELERHQEMYRSMLSEYYSALEAKKAIDIQQMRIGADNMKPKNLKDYQNQTLNVSNLNIGTIHINKTNRNKKESKRRSSTYHNRSLNNTKTEKTDLSQNLPKIGRMKKERDSLRGSFMNFSPSIRNNSEMRGTMKDILSVEEKQYQILRKFVKYSPNSPNKNGIKNSPSEFRPTKLTLQLASHINESTLNNSVSERSASSRFAQ